ncbi:hypothetical protein Tsubulata_037600 [Turnera subulata]|uniref:Uncharacterized protein n=1 Tax=Turnera subulata TaxID=218843 RepID=A0A9Q0GI84_9ROSI|nr:hypothetical protein Tsubulata_037600 [Turnera subulata]
MLRVEAVIGHLTVPHFSMPVKFIGVRKNNNNNEQLSLSSPRASCPNLAISRPCNLDIDELAVVGC